MYHPTWFLFSPGSIPSILSNRGHIEGHISVGCCSKRNNPWPVRKITRNTRALCPCNRQLRQERPIGRIANPPLRSSSVRSDIVDSQYPYPDLPRDRWRSAGARKIASTTLGSINRPLLTELEEGHFGRPPGLSISATARPQSAFRFVMWCPGAV